MALRMADFSYWWPALVFDHVHLGADASANGEDGLSRPRHDEAGIEAAQPSSKGFGLEIADICANSQYALRF